jgi:hypothetical protein
MAALDWFGPEVAAPAARPVRRAQPRARARPQRRVRGGIVWIAAFAVVLTGVVTLNVLVLQVNMRVSRLDKAQIELRTQNEALASQVSSAASAERIEQAAHRLGYVPAPATDTSYLELAQK